MFFKKKKEKPLNLKVNRAGKESQEGNNNAPDVSDSGSKELLKKTKKAAESNKGGNEYVEITEGAGKQGRSKKSWFAQFSRRSKLKAAKKARGAAQEKFEIEKIFSVPGIEVIPENWCREYFIERIESRITRDIIKASSLFLIVVAVFASSIVATYMIHGITSSEIGVQALNVEGKLTQYSNAIKEMAPLRNIMAFTSDIPMEQQCKGITKIFVESGLITQRLRYTHNDGEVPANVKSNFEAANGVKLENASIAGIWFADIFIIKTEGAQPSAEDWIYGMNKGLKSMFTGYKTMVYADLSSSKVNTNDGSSSGELIIVFWK